MRLVERKHERWSILSNVHLAMIYNSLGALRREHATTSEARYLVGLVALNVAATELALRRDFERAWSVHSDKPSYAANFGSDAIILSVVAVSFFVAGVFAMRRVYRAVDDSRRAHGAWSAFVQWLSLTLLVLPVAFCFVPLLTTLMAPTIGMSLLILALSKFGLPLAAASAIWNLVFVMLLRQKP